MNNLYLFEGVPLDMNYENSFVFENSDLQSSYFLSNYNHTELSNQSFVRRNFNMNTGEFQVNGKIGDYLKYSYLMFQADEMGNKIMYGFILGCEILNPNVTIIHYGIDIFQTYLFDFETDNTTIDRVHTPYDTINLQNKSLSVGATANITTSYPYTNISLLYKLSLNPERTITNTAIATSRMFPTNGYYSRLHLYVTEKIESITDSLYLQIPIQTGISSFNSPYYYLKCGSSELLNVYLDQYVTAGKAEAILSVVDVPMYLDPDYDYTTNEGWLENSYGYQNGSTSSQLTKFIYVPSYTQNGYYFRYYKYDETGTYSLEKVGSIFDNVLTTGFPFYSYSISTPKETCEFSGEQTGNEYLSITVTPVYGLNSYLLLQPESIVNPVGCNTISTSSLDLVSDKNIGNYIVSTEPCVNFPYNVDMALNEYNQSAELRALTLSDMKQQQSLDLSQSFANGVATNIGNVVGAVMTPLAIPQLISGGLSTFNDTYYTALQSNKNLKYERMTQEVEKNIASNKPSTPNNINSLANASNVLSNSRYRTQPFYVDVNQVSDSILKEIDYYFTCYGYEIAIRTDISDLLRGLTTSNLYTTIQGSKFPFPRDYFTFLKCDTTITGNLNSQDAVVIKDILKKGITLWKGSSGGSIVSKIDIEKLNYSIHGFGSKRNNPTFGINTRFSFNGQ